MNAADRTQDLLRVARAAQHALLARQRWVRTRSPEDLRVALHREDVLRRALQGVEELLDG